MPCICRALGKNPHYQATMCDVVIYLGIINVFLVSDKLSPLIWCGESPVDGFYGGYSHIQLGTLVGTEASHSHGG